MQDYPPLCTKKECKTQPMALGTIDIEKPASDAGTINKEKVEKGRKKCAVI